jgi:hypothetical protein
VLLRVCAGCSVNYLLHRIAGRILRRVVGIQREPVRQFTEADYRLIDMGYGILIGLAAMGVVTIVLLLLMGRPTC